MPSKGEILKPRRLTVALDQRSYPIIIGDGLLKAAGKRIAPYLVNSRIFIVTDFNVRKHWGARLESSLRQSHIDPHWFTVPAGESSKSSQQLHMLCERILRKNPDRRDLILAFGGGVVGDLAGFAASILLRGLNFIQVPTTLLAQVDSSVGGKTGINSRQGKNVLGSFHQPVLVLADSACLTTLPKREVRAGYAEILKYALIQDAGFFSWLENNGSKIIHHDARATIRAVYQSCMMKAAIVAVDEREAGRRALLNLGHTFGHALEAELEYDGRLLHGEAVAIGLLMAYEFSSRIGICPERDVERLHSHLKTLNLTRRLPPHVWRASRLLGQMQKDKKTEQGVLTLILTRGIGQAFVQKDAPVPALRKYLKDFINRSMSVQLSHGH